MNEQIELEDVLDAYLAAGADAASLNSLIRRFPQYEQDLTEFAASRALMHSMPPPEGAATPSDDELVARGMRILQPLFGARQGPAMPSLIAEARARGLSPQQLRERVGLGTGVLMKLDRRLIAFATIPRAAIEQIAAAIQRDVASVTRYLQQGRTFAPGAAFRAEQAPQLAPPEDFASAVRADPTMTPEERDRWLSQS